MKYAARKGVGVERMVSLKNTGERNENLINHPLPTVVVCPRDAHRRFTKRYA